MSLTSWWHRVSTRWLCAWLERLRRDPDVGLDEFRECEALINDHIAKHRPK